MEPATADPSLLTDTATSGTGGTVTGGPVVRPWHKLLENAPKCLSFFPHNVSLYFPQIYLNFLKMHL